ncbi:MAG: hypothetical protein IKN62_05395 [Elusimicrobia bacterium]|nr:hypothetical protein [Elusimicrobiota bacterium]
MKNIFSYQDQNAGYNALGFKDENDENVKQFNTKYLNKYNTMKNAQYNRVFNDFDESEEELKNKGEMNCVDIYNKHNVSELVPYYASTKAGLDSVMIHKNLNKMRNGELLTNDEVESTRKYVSDMRELQLRGVTLDGRIEETLFGSIPFLVEAGIGFGTAEYGVGLASLGHTSSKFALRQMARGYAKNEIKKQLKKGANELAKNRTKQIIKDSTIGNLKFSATYTSPEWIRKSGEFMLSDDVAVSERGQYILNMSNSNPAKATMLALGDTMIENLSETSGELFGLAGKAIGKSGTGQAVKRCIDKNVLKKLPSGFAEKFESAVEKSLNMPFVTALHKYGYHGIIEEMGEERVGDFLRVACNIDGEEGYSVEQFLNALFPSADQLATEAIAFGLTGGAIAGGIHVTKKAINKKQYKNFANDIREATKKEDGTYDFEKMRDLISLKNPDLTDEQFENIKKAVTEGIKKGEEYTVDDFLVDTGIIRTPYNNSITDDRIINTLSKYMTNPEDIDTVVNFADNQTKAKLISAFGSQELSEGAEEIKKDFEEKLLQRGVSKQNADLSARLYSALLQTRADRTGRDIEDLYAETNLKIKESDEDEYWQNVAEQYEQFAQVDNSDIKNLLMTHSAKIDMIDNIIMSGSLVAPSMAITKKGENEALKNFGDVLFVRNPKKIDFQNDNIFDRDIYSPRMPRPSYELKNGRIVDAYEYDNLQRMDDERFKKSFGTTKDKYFEGAKKVLNLGYTPSGNIKTKAYNANTLLEYVSRNKLLGGEGFDYGLSSLLAKLSKQQTSKEQLKETAKKELELSNSELADKYKEIREKYNHFDEKLKDYYIGENYIFTDIGDIFYAVAKNNKKKLSQYLDLEKMPKTLLKEMKDLINEALSLPRSYFESKPMRKVDLGEFTYAIAKKGTLSEEQKRELSLYGLEVVEYEGDNVNEVLSNLNDKNEIYFQEEEPEQQSVFEGNNKARGVRKIKGSYMPAEKLIEFFKDADESTIVHEFAHWYLDSLIEDAKYHEASADDLAEVRKFVKNNGENFTREQHEKFARGFEAYIRSGRARSNRLKKIFEDFKNALLQIYDTITQIIYTEEGVEKPFTEEDLPQINALFERLLTTETERIRATVFDKVNEIEEQINKIKENEQKEFDELDTIYKDNIEILNRKSDKRRKVEEYLDLAIRSARRETKEVKEWKKRYKNATLDILSAISGKPRNWVANSRNWEKLSELVGNADDKITTSGGLRAEWQDFYADTGVSYDNDEIDGDYKLGEQALQKLIDGNFNPPRADEAYWADVEYFAGQFDYLAKKVRSLKGEEQQVAYEALIEVLFNKAPEMPEGIYSEFVNNFMKLSEDVEEIKKEDFNRKHYPNIPVVQQLQFYVTNKLNDLRIYNPKMRYKTRLDRSHGLYKSIKNATSVNDTKRIVKKINDFVIEDLRNGQRAILNKEIQKQLKINSKLVKVGSIKRGKFDWRTNTVFAELSQMNKLSREDAQAQYDEVMKINEIEAGEERIDWKTGTDDLSETFDTDFQNNLKRKFLQYKSSRLKNLDVRHTESLLEDILKLKFEGRRAKDEEDFKKRTERLDYRNNLIQILDANKDNKAVKFFANWVVKSGTLTNWETLLNTVFNAETAEKYSLQRLESQVQVFARNKTLELINKANKIYGFNNNKWDKALDYDGMQKFIKLMQDYENETYDYSEVTWNKETREAVKTGLKLSKAQIMTLYIWCQNDDLFQRLNNQYGLEQLKDMFSRLTESDKDMCLEFINVCESMYDDMNEVYINTYGISLPKVENYFPSVTERVGSDLDMFHDFVVKSSNPSFIKTRKVCNKIPMKPKSPLEIILPHINKSANYILTSETVNFYNKIFKETPLNKKIVDIYGKKDGEKIVRAIQNQLSASTFTTVARGLTFAHEFADNLATNFISSSIAGSPKVMFAQLLSCINYSEKMPVHEWAKGFAKAIANPKKTFEYMLSNCEYLQARLAGNTQNEMMSTLTSEVDRFRTIKNFCSLTTKWGDITAIVFGGKPYVDYLMSQGMSKEDAFNKFVDDTLRAQQAGLNSTTSEWQKAQTKTAMGRAFFAFNNTNLQYERKFIDSLSKFAKGDIDSKDFAKSLIIYKVLNPIMFTSILGNLSLLELVRALTGGDDDPEKAIRKFGGDILLAIMLGSLGAYGIAGLIAISLINYGKAYIDKKIFGEKPFVFKSSVPILDVIDDVGSKALKNEFTLADSIDVICGLGDIGTGLPMSRFENAFGGAENIAQGEYGIGATRMLGWGEYKASEAWTGKSPKERKKNKK